MYDQPPSAYVEESGPSQLTVEEKLQAVRLEAEHATSASASASHSDDLHNGGTSQLDLDLDEETSKARSPVRKTRIQGRPRRRKSTLSPEELDNLILGGGAE